MCFKHFKVLLLIVSMSIFTLAHANNKDGYMLITQKNSTNANDIYVDLGNHPTISFEAHCFTIASENLSISYENTLSISFVSTLPVVDNIEATTAPQQKFSFINKNTIMISGVTTIDEVKIYALDGKKVTVKTELHSNDTTLYLDELPNGIYIISTKYQSFKVVKK